MKKLEPKQILFKELFVGTLIYASTLGFFNDYTNLVQAKSFSFIFLSGLTMQILTSLIFVLKKQIVKALKPNNKILMVFSVWLVMFFSKFVFIWVIAIAFGSNVNISGFFTILALVATSTILHKIADYVFESLGNKT